MLIEMPVCPNAIVDSDIHRQRRLQSRCFAYTFESIGQSESAESVIRVFRALSNTTISGCTMASDNSRWLARGYE